MAETEVWSEGLEPQKIRAERPEAFLKDPQGPALGILAEERGEEEKVFFFSARTAKDCIC